MIIKLQSDLHYSKGSILPVCDKLVARAKNKRQEEEEIAFLQNDVL